MANDQMVMTRPAPIDYEMVPADARHVPGAGPGLRHPGAEPRSCDGDAVFCARRGGQEFVRGLSRHPHHSSADGVSVVRASLLTVLNTRETDVTDVIRHDVKGAMGGFEPRWWQITNTPILGDDGYVRWIINRAEDVTELVGLRPGKG